MLLVRIKTRPRKPNPYFGKYGTTFADVLVNTDNEIAAKTRAKGYLDALNWEIIALEEVCFVLGPENYNQDKPLIEAYRTAEKHGIHCFLTPVPAESENQNPQS